MACSVIDYNQSINETLRDIVKPFLHLYGFNHLIYIKLTEPNRRLYLSTNHEWVEKYITNRFFNDVDHENNVISPSSRKKFAFWDGFIDDKIFKAANYVEMWHGFIIYDGNEIFAFTTTQSQRNQINRHLASAEEFYYFIFYFREKAHKIINPSANLFFLTERKVSDWQINDLESSYETLKRLIPLNRIHIKDKHNNDYILTIKEALTLESLANGKTFAEAAYYLNISSRTFEKHVENLKRKLNSFSKSRLIDIYHQTNLKNLKL
jgi:DNA-binding CsgD family transcriptional regulator